MVIQGSDGTLETSEVRLGEPASDGEHGNGVIVQLNVQSGLSSIATLDLRAKRLHKDLVPSDPTAREGLKELPPLLLMPPPDAVLAEKCYDVGIA